MYVDGLISSAIARTQTEPPQAPAASETPAEAPGLMPELGRLACSGDPGAMLAALTMQAAKNERDVSRAQRDNAERMQEADEAKEIQALHEKADLVRIQGIVDGCTQMANAALNLASTLGEMHASSESKEAEAEKADLKQHQAEHSQGWSDAMQHSIDTLEAGASSSKTTATWEKTGTEFLTAGQKIADGLLQGAIVDKDTESKAADMAAQSAKRMVDDARSDESDAKQLMEKAIEFLKEYNDTRAQTMLAATHRA